MKTTVKRVLWQRTLETAGPLRKALPVAPESEHGPAVFSVNPGAKGDGVTDDTAAIQAGKLTVHELVTAYARALVADTVKNAAAAFQAMRLGKPYSASAGGSRRGGLLERNPGVFLVGETGPELVVKIPAGALKVGEPVDFGRRADQLMLALQQMVSEMNEVSK